jgi:ribosomal protein S18 acetylase RimI-like enzyme
VLTVNSDQAPAAVTDATEERKLFLGQATSSDIDQLMSWFSSKKEVSIWGGPGFRYPYTRETFHEDVRWREMATKCVRDSEGRFLAFGQFYNRFDRINLARLVVHPDMRGCGIGRILVSLLMNAARPLFPLTEFSLFVYRDNTPALECYKSMGFVIQDYPNEMRMRDVCFYLTRPIEAQE